MKIRLSELRQIIAEEIKEKDGQEQNLDEIFGFGEKTPEGKISAEIDRLPGMVKAAYKEISAKIKNSLKGNREASGIFEIEGMEKINENFADDLLETLLKSESVYASDTGIAGKIQRGLAKLTAPISDTGKGGVGGPKLGIADGFQRKNKLIRENLQDLQRDSGELMSLANACLGAASGAGAKADAQKMDVLQAFYNATTKRNIFPKTSDSINAYYTQLKNWKDRGGRIDSEVLTTLCAAIGILFSSGSIDFIKDEAFMKEFDAISPFIQVKNVSNGKIEFTKATKEKIKSMLSTKSADEKIAKISTVEPEKMDTTEETPKKISGEEKDAELMKYFGTNDVASIRKNLAKTIALAGSKDSRGKMLRNVVLANTPAEKRKAEELLKTIIAAEARKILKGILK